MERSRKIRPAVLRIYMLMCSGTVVVIMPNPFTVQCFIRESSRGYMFRKSMRKTLQLIEIQMDFENVEMLWQFTCFLKEHDWEMVGVVPSEWSEHTFFITLKAKKAEKKEELLKQLTQWRKTLNKDRPQERDENGGYRYCNIQTILMFSFGKERINI